MKTLEAEAVIMRGEVNYDNEAASAQATIELRTINLVGEERAPLQSATLGMLVDLADWNELRDVMHSVTGRVRIRIEFYADADGEDDGEPR